MRQVLQHQKSGQMFIAEVPTPALKKESVIVQNIFSLISTGTEKMSVATAKASMLGKAKMRPDLVRQVLMNMKKEGVLATYKKIQNRLDNYKSLGYSSAGYVVESNTSEFKVGDRVACAGFAYHAELIVVPKNLVAHVPDDVSFEEAAFTTLGAIAMQGVRQADVRIGEKVAVVGMGLLGLITIQLLKAAGCRVVGMDVSNVNFALAKEFGCDECVVSNRNAIRQVSAFTGGRGTDAVIITAATPSNEPIELSLEFARKRSNIVVVGAVKMDIPRSPFYEKELSLKIATSYGPGRYDTEYEEKGNDYPIGFVRWTAKRNMESFLDLISAKKIGIQSLISHRFDIDAALDAYDIVLGKRKEKHLGLLIEYPKSIEKITESSRRLDLKSSTIIYPASQPVIGFIGAGNFAQSYLLPTIRANNIRLKGVCNSNPVNAKSVGEKFGFEYCATSTKEILSDNEISTVFIATRHDSHADYVVRALQEGKHVFVEKPLAITHEQLKKISTLYQKESTQPTALMVGFNRRFSNPFIDIKQFFSGSLEPFVMTYRVNAGILPQNHWVNDTSQGGRIIGEGCHFIDTMQFISGALPIKIFSTSLKTNNTEVKSEDNVQINLNFSDGSIGTLIYLSNGDTALPKEYCEVSSGGKSVIMNDFKEVHFYENGKVTKKKYDGNKGHQQEVEHFIEVIKGNVQSRLSFDSILATTAASICAVDSLQKGKPVVIK